MKKDNGWIRPPGWADRMLAWWAPREVEDEIRGDLLEMYIADVKRKGVRAARRKYVLRVAGFLTKRFFWRRRGSNNSTIMTGSYFKMARRSLAANKGTTIINVLGLVIGIASALVILSVIRFEESFDTFHSEYNNIYRLVRVSDGDKPEYRAGISIPVADALENGIPAIKKIVSMEYFGASNVDVLSRDGRNDKTFWESGGLAIAEPEFFDMFDFAEKPLHWIAGDPATALKEPNTMVITKEMATKYFGKEEPLGQTLRFQKKFDFKVTGVLDDFPANTDFPLKLIISYATMKNLFGDGMNDWVSVNDMHYVFIYAPDISREDLELQIDKIHRAHVHKDIADSRHYRLQEFREMHFDPRFGNISGRTITHETLLALKIIVVFLLLVGCINYINLSTAQSTLRSKEIGLRKVMGSDRRHLILQFLAETFVVVSLAAVTAVIIVLAFMPSIQNLLSLRIGYDLADPFLLTTILAIVLAVTLFSGLYPALLISRFNPVATLRNKLNSEKIGGVNLRKVLVVAQFSITQILAVGTFIVVTQMNFFQNVDMGFNRNAVIINMPILDNDPRFLRPMTDDLNRLSYVSGVSASFTLPSGLDRNRSSRSIGRPDAQTARDYLDYAHYSIDDQFLDMYGIKLLAGRQLKESDTSGGAILINRMLMERLQLASPEDALGEELKFGRGEKVTVVGVVDNFYSNSLKEGVDNMAFIYRPKEYRWLGIRLNLSANESMTDALTGIERIWTRHYPGLVFRYTFLDDNVRAFYKQEFKYSKLFQIFSGIFIGIGCLGLFGLITFIANKKGKEIAIRKTLGASITNIIVMFSREYILLILVSFVIAVPVVWFPVNDWLNGFQNHITPEWWMFAFPGILVLVVALLVVGTKSFNAARVNPVEKLKCE